MPATKALEADKIVRSHVLWALGAGLMPVPLFDIAAVTALQMDMLKQLADVYEADFSKSTGKTFVSALAGSTTARIGASLVKAVPGVGTVLGGVSMSALSGASTYAVGQVPLQPWPRRRRPGVGQGGLPRGVRTGQGVRFRPQKGRGGLSRRVQSPGEARRVAGQRCDQRRGVREKEARFSGRDLGSGWQRIPT